jgi:hypothetical protein
MQRKELHAMLFAQDGYSPHSFKSKSTLLLKERKLPLMKLMLSLFQRNNLQEKQALLKI